MESKTLPFQFHMPYLGNMNAARVGLLILFTLLIVAMPALAQDNPLSGISIVPNSSDSKDVGGMLKFFIKLIVVALAFTVLIYVFADAILSLFAALRDARRDGEIGKFFLMILLIMIGIGFAIFVGFLMFELLGKFETYFTTK